MVLLRLIPLVALLLMVAIPVAAIDAATEFARANSLYEREDYREALAVYESILAEGKASSQVLGNTGNAAFKIGDRGRAVLYYVRALQLDPRNDMARQNLLLIQPRTNVASDDDLLRALKLWLVMVPAWIWIVVAEIAFVSAIIALLMGSWRSRAAGEMTDWSIRAAGLLFVALVSAGGGALAESVETGQGFAVVMQDEAVTRVGPGERYLEQLSLPAGTMVELPDPPADGWVRCRLKDGRTGFIRTELLEPI